MPLRLATRWRERLRGRLGATSLPREALLIAPCRLVHSLGMRVSVDLVFVAADGTLLRVQTLAPWRVAGCWQAVAVLELPAGMAQAAGWQAGQRLQLWPGADDTLWPGSGG